MIFGPLSECASGCALISECVFCLAALLSAESRDVLLRVLAVFPSVFKADALNHGYGTRFKILSPSHAFDKEGGNPDVASPWKRAGESVAAVTRSVSRSAIRFGMKSDTRADPLDEAAVNAVRPATPTGRPWIPQSRKGPREAV